MTITNEPAGNAGVSRRTVTKAMAWAVPAIAVATAVPAFAASQGIFQLDGTGCKLPGNSSDPYKGYAFGITATNPFAVQIVIEITSLFLDTTDLGDVLIIQTDPNDSSVCAAEPVNFLTIPGNTTLTNLVVLTQNAANSSQGALTVNYTVSGGPGGDYTATGSADVSPPIQGAQCVYTDDQVDCLRNFV